MRFSVLEHLQLLKCSVAQHVPKHIDMYELYTSVAFPKGCEIEMRNPRPQNHTSATCQGCCWDMSVDYGVFWWAI